LLHAATLCRRGMLLLVLHPCRRELRPRMRKLYAGRER
jgi:hypothetical protein